MALFDFLIHRTHINGLFLVGSRRREKHEKVMALSSRSLGSGLSSKVDKVDVVDNDVGIVLLPPLFAKGVIEPSVVSGNKMAPLKNFQRFLLRCCAFREQKKRAGAHPGCEGTAPSPLDKVSP